MPTNRTASTRAAALIAIVALGIALPAAGERPAPATAAPHESPEPAEAEEEGYAAAQARGQDPHAIEAAFPAESYAPGTTARLRLWTSVPSPATVAVFHMGRERVRTVEDNELHGTPTGLRLRVAALRAGETLALRVGDWPSGLYFAKLTAAGRVGYAPFVVRPKRLGTNRVAVVMPTRTWQAYNFRDDDADGAPDTWYAMRGDHTARLGRPFLNRGVPPHFRRYDLRFLRWLHRTGRGFDVLAQEDLDEATGAELAAAYELIVFPGHHEYVTAREYDAVEGFRDRGGNLAFLSANNFFWRIDVRGGVMTRIAKWRDLGRPEAALLGVQYIANDRGRRKAPWLVRRVPAAKWLFERVPLRNGREFSEGNVEIDATAPSSPRGTQVVAEIPNLLGPGLTAQMTYYETARGAKVFAAGAFTLAGNVYDPAVRVFLTNLWEHLARVDGPEGAGLRSPTRRGGGSLGPSALRGVAHALPQYASPKHATDYERAEATRLLAALEAASAPWRNPRAAAAAGFDTRRPKRRDDERRVMWLHAEHREYHHDDAYLDPSRPDTLIYADVPGAPLRLVGAMFSMPRGLTGSSPGGPITRWHWHDVCASPERRGTKPLPDGSCPPGTSLRGGSEMLHVWFTGDLRSAYAIHAPVPELCAAGLVPAPGCGHAHRHSM